jgi:hypothetical protein
MWSVIVVSMKLDRNFISKKDHITATVSLTCHATSRELRDLLFTPEAEFLDEIQTKVFKSFLLAIQSHHYSFALRFIFVQTHATSYSFFSALLYTVMEKGGKLDRKPPQPLPYGLRNPYRNLKSKNAQDYAQKPQ